MLFKVKSVNAVIGRTQRWASVSFGFTSWVSMNVWFAQNPPYVRALVSLGLKYPQHWNCADISVRAPAALLTTL